ncbi:hypothetical protein [Chelativorans sp. M5D2P16]|uniref:hypothetical protein n=1 Tax=Chelativorans sp. M5D2P16 TaxID=3095678 RepID=UPI002ACAC85D|nr:hypothetical protein [Chelativorans sp. M5D2P16]MDZ5696880.1 hypothetical protein [Chelativorans sp. M5D2P16]
MSIHKDLFLAIISMDSYNRGYNAGLSDGKHINNGIDYGLGDTVGTQIGTAKIIRRSDSDPNSFEVNAGFYGVAYEWNGQTIISYRGTDDDDVFDTASDIWNGWTMGAGYPDSSEGRLAIKFYETVVRQMNGDPSLTVYDDAPVKPLLVGHSLGGGLAGFVSALSGTPAMVFDHMPFGAAAMGAVDSELQRRVAGVDDETSWLPFNFNSVPVTPERLTSLGMHVPDFDMIRAMHVQGEVAEGLRDGSTALRYGALGTALGGLLGPLAAYFGYKVSTGQSEAERKIDNTQLETFGWDGDETARHKQALLVTLLYAKENHGDDWHAVADSLLDAFFDDYVAHATDRTEPYRFPRTSDIVGDVQTAIAYSALDEGTLPFGNTGIRAIFDDAGQLGRIMSADDAPAALKDFVPVIAKFIVAYGGLLAVKADTDAGHRTGILSIDDDTASVSIVGPEWISQGCLTRMSVPTAEAYTGQRQNCLAISTSLTAMICAR